MYIKASKEVEHTANILYIHVCLRIAYNFLKFKIALPMKHTLHFIQELIGLVKILLICMILLTKNRCK